MNWPKAETAQESIVTRLVERASAIAAQNSIVWVVPASRLSEEVALRLRAALPSAVVLVLGMIANGGLVLPDGVTVQGANQYPDIVVVGTDTDKEVVLRALNGISWVTIPRIVAAGTDHLLRDYQIISTLEEVLPVESAAAGYSLVKHHLYDVIKFHANRQSRGYIVELGVFKGGTTLLLAALARQAKLRLDGIVGFDTFSGFPPKRSVLDAFDLKEFVLDDAETLKSVERENCITLIRGDIYDTATTLKDHALILTFVDTDNYSAVLKALPVCAENTIVGGAIVFDHYFTDERYWQTIGERMAAIEFFSHRTDFLHLAGTGVFIRI